MSRSAIRANAGLPGSRSTPSRSYSSIAYDLIFSHAVELPLINAVLALRNHAFKPGLVDEMEDRSRVARQSLAELNAPVGRYQRLEDVAPIDQRHVAQIVAVQVQQIERHEIEVVLAPGDGLPELAEVGMSRLIQHDDFTVDDGAFGIELAGGFDKIPVLRGPVEPATREDANAARVAHYLRTVAVKFDLVDPPVALWRLVDQGRQQRGSKGSRTPAASLSMGRANNANLIQYRRSVDDPLAIAE